MNIPFLVSSQSASQAGLASQTETRKGDPCGQDGCTSKRFRLGDDGTWYCRNGHQQPEGLEAGVDEGDFQRTLGRQVTTAQPTEEQVRARERDVGTNLTGTEAFELYLLCYQHILRHQCRWLIEQRPCLPSELETIVHDLWALRLQSLTNRIPSLVGEDDDPTQQLFSSQADSADDSATDTLPKERTGRPPASTPKLIDTLCLIYLAIQLLHIPYNFSDIQEWVRSSSRSPLPYYRAIRCLPSSMRQKLPGSYHHVLEPTVLLTCDALHHAFIEVVLYYRTQFGMVVPPLNYPLLLFRYIKTLALPLEVYGGAKKLAKIVGYKYEWPESRADEHGDMTNKRSIGVENWPDAQLAAVLVVATKLLFPFDDIKRYPRTNSESAAAVIDWPTWADMMLRKEKDSNATRKKGSKAMPFRKAIEVEENDILTFEEEDLDSYLHWYQDTWMEDEVKEYGRHRSTAGLRKALFDMFPIPKRQHEGTNDRLDGQISSSPPFGADAELAIQEASGRKGVHDEDVEMADSDTPPISHVTTKKKDHEEDIIALMQSSLLPQRVISSEAESALPPVEKREVNRPGSYYRQWRSVEDLDVPLAGAQPPSTSTSTSTSTRPRRSTSKGTRGTRGTTGASGEEGRDLVSMPARVFAESVAKETGLELETLIKAVWKTEVRLRRWDLARRREEEGWSSGEDGARRE